MYPVITYGSVWKAAKPADCKSVTSETSKVRVLSSLPARAGSSTVDVCKRVLLFEIYMGCAIVLEECVQKLLREGVTLEAKNQMPR